MKYGQNKNCSPQAISAAIQAVEQQALHDNNKKSADTGAKEGQFFALLDRHADKIFAGIASQANNNERTFYLTTLPDFRGQCDQIFAKGFGDFPSQSVNHWLYARDLKHLFHCNGNAIVW